MFSALDFFIFCDIISFEKDSVTAYGENVELCTN